MMFNIFLICRCVSTTIFIWATRMNRVANNVTGDCIYNTFQDGDVCKDCPGGYFGHNCSEKCTAPSYGLQCSQVCLCSACHHIYGCNLATESSEIEPNTTKHKQSPELQSVKNTTNQKLPVETTTQIPKKDITPKKDKTPEKIIIILIGSSICLVLMFEIRREIYLYMEVNSEASCA